MIYDYENWTGTRPELVTLIRIIEQNYPNQYKMYSKQLGKLISINERRIQQFIDEGIVPKPVFENKKYQ